MSKREPSGHLKFSVRKLYNHWGEKYHMEKGSTWCSRPSNNIHPIKLRNSESYPNKKMK